MRDLLESVRALKKSRVKKLVDDRIKEFKENSEKPDREVFKELCFCLLTANYNAEKAIKIQQAIGDGFLDLPQQELEERLRALGYRYPVTRAGYITNARKHVSSLEIMRSLEDSVESREWLVKNVVGLGYKEASHFLRNIGRDDVAIIDFHVVDLLARHGLVEKPRTLTKKKYLEIEAVLRRLAGRVGLTQAELDLYLWYLETGRVLK